MHKEIETAESRKPAALRRSERVSGVGGLKRSADARPNEFAEVAANVLLGAKILIDVAKTLRH